MACYGQKTEGLSLYLSFSLCIETRALPKSLSLTQSHPKGAPRRSRCTSRAHYTEADSPTSSLASPSIPVSAPFGDP
ncbi:hypothetical protein HYQ44_003629 [Verticillium longisporum]|nr:hypothetical protein HYQ44_003629 [Verticillium longisporum]